MEVVKQRDAMSAGSCLPAPESPVPTADNWPPLLVAAVKHCMPLQAAGFRRLSQSLAGGSCQLCPSCGQATLAAGHHGMATSLSCRLQPAPKCDHPSCECCPATANGGQGHWLAVCHFLIMTSPRSDPASAYALAAGSRCQQDRHLSEGFALQQQLWPALAAIAEPHLL